MTSVRYYSWCLNIALSVGLLFASVSISSASAQDQTASPDNSANDARHALTADQQASSPGDRKITQQIRKAVIADKTLSTYAHNVKIIASNGTVTLKGPVKSEEEKQRVATLAAEIAGGSEKITNEISVKQ
jgi:osmotically-inducible protein OsmY